MFKVVMIKPFRIKIRNTSIDKLKKNYNHFFPVLFRQWSALQELVNNEPGHGRINNETLERIRKNYSPAPSIRVQRTASAKRNYYQPYNENQLEPLVETSAQSLCDASDLSFDDDSRLVICS